MRNMGNSRHVTLTRRFVMTAVCSLLLVGCGNSSDAPPRSSAPPKSTTTTPPPAWESNYTAGELAIYREAVQRVEAYEAKSQPIYAAGKATKAAKEIFQDNLLSWQSEWAQQQSYDKKRIKIARGPVALSTEAKSIKLLKDDAASVELTRCTDQTDLGGTMNSEPLANAYDEPVIQEVDVYRYSDGRWRIGVFKTLETTCTG